MIIRMNGPATTALRYGSIINRNAAKDLEKLSSGISINRAADDAAGLAISEKMRMMIRESIMCENNTQQGISASNTADGALNEISAMLLRARELCVQASNGVYDGSDRRMLEGEVRQLFDEIDRITESTHYNNIPLLRWGGGIEQVVTGRNIVGEVSSADPFDWGALLLPGLPSNFAKTEPEKAASVTMSLDPSIDFSDWESLEGKRVTIPLASGSTTVTFSQYNSAEFSERYPQGGAQIKIDSSKSVQAWLEDLASTSSIVSDVKVDVSARNITFTATTSTGTETLTDMRTEGSPINVNVSNPYKTGTTHNNKQISSSGAFLKPLGGGYPRANRPFTYSGDASVTIALGAIVSDGQTLSASQVKSLTHTNPAASNPQHRLEIDVLGTIKNIYFSAEGAIGTVTGDASSQTIVIKEGMSGAELREALTTAFAGLGVEAEWSGTDYATLSLSVDGLDETQWGAISLREVTVPQTGSAGTPDIPATPGSTVPEPPITVTGYSANTNTTALKITSTSTYLSETGQYLHEITVPTAAEIRAAVTANGASKAAVSLGSYVFYDGSNDYSPKDVAWTAPSLNAGQTASGGADSGTTDFAMSDRYSGGIDISTLSDDQLMNYVYTTAGANPDASGNIYRVTSSSSLSFPTNSSSRISFRKTVDTGRTITTPGTPGTPGTPSTIIPPSTAQITGTTYRYFTREATVPKTAGELQIPLNGSDVDIAALAGSGFQMTLQTNPTASTTTAQRLYEFRTTGTNGALDSATGTYIINIAECVTTDEVAGRIESAITTATSANAGADVKVAVDADGKLSISSSYRTSNSTFPGSFNDGQGASGLFGAGTVNGLFSGGTKEVPPNTTVDFSSINSSNVTDLLGKGFRISCGTCAAEYFNVIFVEDLNEISNVEAISIFTDPDTGVATTYYNYFVELNASTMSQTFGGDDIVDNIVSQLTPQMKNHFTSISAGEPKSTLVVSDKRYTPGGMGGVIPGIYTDFRYSATVQDIYADPPEGIQYQELPIYVNSVGPQYVINLHIPHLTLETLELVAPPDLDFTSVDNANEWLSKVSDSAEKIAGVRSVFGADTNRLEAAYKLLTNAEIQVTASESTIRDLDVAKQMMEFTKNNMLLQCVQSALAQANQIQQGIMGLLNAVG